MDDICLNIIHVANYNFDVPNVKDVLKSKFFKFIIIIYLFWFF